MDKLILERIEVDTIIGLLDEEKSSPQKLFIDITIYNSIHDIKNSDKIDDGIDYCEIIQSTREFAKIHQVNTIEFFAQQLAHHLKNTFQIKDTVSVTVEKPRYAKDLKVGAIKVHVEG
jgi:dihydroneopterin aldolase